MNIGYRVFVVDENNEIIPISQRSFNDFHMKDKPSLPRFAGRTISVAIVLYTLENRKPNQIFRIDFMRMKVGDDGAPDQEHSFDRLRLVANRVETPFAEEPPVKNPGPVVNAIEKFDERRWSQLHPQLPGPALKRILKILFGARHAG
ncbi:MAG: hypothetical protein Q8M11_19875 [Sulfuritalea sp.]|nr:hypothetical protein [Sulfuritalea sp.]MDP1981017.1 hypothetical protein [Sulfuritalea sp.]